MSNSSRLLTRVELSGLRDHCDMSIVLAILFQNLTTEVTGKSSRDVGHMTFDKAVVVRQSVVADDYPQPDAKPYAF